MPSLPAGKPRAAFRQTFKQKGQLDIAERTDEINLSVGMPL